MLKEHEQTELPNHSPPRSSLGIGGVSISSYSDRMDALPASGRQIKNHDLSKATQCESPRLHTPPGYPHGRSVQEHRVPFCQHNASQSQFSASRNGAAENSNWQPPSVEDTDDTHGGRKGFSAESPAIHLPTLRPLERACKRPIESANPAPIAEIPPRETRGSSLQTSASDGESISRARVAAARGSHVPRLATKEPHTDLRRVPNRKRGPEGLERGNQIVKCARVESPVQDRLDATSRWSVLRRRPFPMELYDRQVDGPRSRDAIQDSLRFLQDSIADEAEHMRSVPLPQQDRGPPESRQPSHMANPTHVPFKSPQACGSGSDPTITERDHNQRPVGPTRNAHPPSDPRTSHYTSDPRKTEHRPNAALPSLGENRKGCVALPSFNATGDMTAFGLNHAETPVQRASAAPVISSSTPLSHRVFTEHRPALAHSPSLSNEARNQGITSAERTADFSQASATRNSVRTDPASFPARSFFTQGPLQTAQPDRLVEELNPTLQDPVPHLLKRGALQTNASPSEPVSMAFSHPINPAEIPAIEPLQTPRCQLSTPDVKKWDINNIPYPSNLETQSNMRPRKRSLSTDNPSLSSSNNEGLRAAQAFSGSRKSPEKERAIRLGMMGPSQIQTVSSTRGANAHTELDVQSRGFETAIPEPRQAPNKRLCLGLDSPYGLGFAARAPRAKGPVLIMEFSGLHVLKVHRRARSTIKSFFEDYFCTRLQYGYFLNRHLQIVELDPKKPGAIRISDYFQIEDVLVFQRNTCKGVNRKRFMKRVERTVIRNEDVHSLHTKLHKYKTRIRA